MTMPVNKLFGIFKYAAAAALLLTLGLVYFNACAPVPTRGKPGKFKFERKECLDCHTEFAAKYLTMPNVHAVVKEKKCEDCHLRHGIVPKLLLKKEGNQVCFPCHDNQNIGLDKSIVHTGLKQGQCIDCHNPHASTERNLLKAKGDLVCFQCHQKKNFAKPVVHEALRTEDCQRCHFAHSSDQPDLLKENEPALCLSCHDAQKAPFKTAHQNYPVETAACDSCHAPHSSVQRGLLKTSAHPMMDQAKCQSCHDNSTTPKPFAVTQKGSRLCYQCHKAGDLMAGGRIEHQPFQKGECLACHQPHASENLVLPCEACWPKQKTAARPGGALMSWLPSKNKTGCQ